MSSTAPAPTGHATATPPFDPLDMRNYGLEKLKDIAAGPWMARARLLGVPLGLLAFFYFHLKWCGPISFFDVAEVKNISHLYTVTGIFAFSLILWMTEALPSYLTSFMIIVSTILLGIMPMRTTFAYLGEPVMTRARRLPRRPAGVGDPVDPAAVRVFGSSTCRFSSDLE